MILSHCLPACCRTQGETLVFNEMFEFTCDNLQDDLLKITLVDANDQTRGVATFTIATIQEHDKRLAMLDMSAGRGTIVVHVTEKVQEGALRLILKGKDLKNTEGFTNLRKPDPFWVLSRMEGEEWYVTIVCVESATKIRAGWKNEIETFA